MRLILAALLAAVCPMLGQTARTYVLAGEVEAPIEYSVNVLDTWTGTGLYRLRGWDTFYCISRDGTREDFALDIPDASSVRIWRLAGGRDGAVAGIASVLSSAYPNGVSEIFWISPDRQRRTLVPLSPYRAQAITIAPDGTLWTVGFIADREGRTVANGILRHFDTSGKLLRSYEPRVSQAWSRESFLRTSSDRIGWYIRCDKPADEYLELSLDKGEVIGRYAGIPHEDGDGLDSVALSRENEFLAGTWNALTHKARTYALDRDKRAWIPVTLQGEKGQSMLLGFDEDRLVLSGWRLLRFYKPAPR